MQNQLFLENPWVTFYPILFEAFTRSSPEGRIISYANLQISDPCLASCKVILKHILTIIL